MIRHTLLLAAAIGFIAQSSVFAADPAPAPSPAKEAVTESASPTASPEKKTRRRARVEARRKGRETRREARKEPKAIALHRKRLRLHRLRSNKSYSFAIYPHGRSSCTEAVFCSRTASQDRTRLVQPERLSARADFFADLQVSMPGTCDHFRRGATKDPPGKGGTQRAL